MRRFGLLVKRELQTKKRDLSIYALTIFLILLASETINNFLAQYFRMPFPPAPYENLFPYFLFFGGLIITSLAFVDDMFSKNGQQEWLMLPATSLEKFLAKAMLTSWVYPLALIAVFFATSVIIEPLFLLFFSNSITLFNPFTRIVGRQLASYWVIQSLFLLGATFFRKGHFLKTTLSIGTIMFALSILGLLFIKIIFTLRYGRSLGTFELMFSFDSLLLSRSTGALRFFRILGKTLYYGALPFFCWVTAYLRVEEVQATDAIQ